MASSQNTITVKVEVDSEALRKDVSALLERYSEWLDSEGLVVPPDRAPNQDNRTHDELVRDFFSEDD